MSQYKKPDRYTKKAQNEGFEARSVYKLEEIDKRARIFRPGQSVVDLGCFPGSWSQYAIQRIGNQGTLVGVDLREPRISNGTFITRSVYEVSSEEILEVLGSHPDVVLSDMAQNTCGDKMRDHYMQIELANCALERAVELLAPGGSFICKVFEGSDAKAFFESARKHFTKTKRVRPKAVRTVSREWFLVATGFK